MKKYKYIIYLELYAVMLALLHMQRGVLTDEAKYLLNIPYPHPPLVRWLMSQLDWMTGIPGQEFFVRVVIATIVVQSVQFVWSMGKSFTNEQQKFFVACWLISAPVLLQAGTVMMAPLTAVQALIFLWMLHRPVFVQKYVALVGLFWLVSLFTAYQIILFLPVVVCIFWKTDIKRWEKLVCIGVPLVLLALYSLSNPLIPASMVYAGTQNAALSVGQRIEHILLLWVVGGSFIVSLLGTTGMVVQKRWELLLTLLLLCLYISLSYRFYYAILFTPLFLAGIVAMPRVLSYCAPCRLLLGVVSIGLFLQYGPSEQPSIARIVGQRLQHIDGMVLIEGDYGHEWQYEIHQVLRRYKEEWIEDASAVICLEECASPGEHWSQPYSLPVTVWVSGE